MDQLLTSSSFWGLVGVVIGFALGEGHDTSVIGGAFIDSKG